MGTIIISSPCRKHIVQRPDTYSKYTCMYYNKNIWLTFTGRKLRVQYEKWSKMSKCSWQWDAWNTTSFRALHSWGASCTKSKNSMVKDDKATKKPLLRLLKQCPVNLKKPIITVETIRTLRAMQQLDPEVPVGHHHFLRRTRIWTTVLQWDLGPCPI